MHLINLQCFVGRDLIVLDSADAETDLLRIYLLPLYLLDLNAFLVKQTKMNANEVRKSKHFKSISCR